MKISQKVFLFLIATSYLNLLSAQITISEVNMPVANMIYSYENALDNGIDPSSEGSDLEWDYSDLTGLNSDADTTIDINEAESIFQLVFNNPVLFGDYVSDYYLSAQGFDLGGLTVEDLSNFYRTTSNSFEQTGFGALLNGLPAPVAFNPKDVIYELPMNYEDSTFNYAFFEADIPGLGYWSEDIFRTNEVIGWGTLILPDATYETLKVKTTLNRTDSLFIEFLGFGSNFPLPEVIEYKWLAEGEMSEVLTVTTILGQVTNVRYLSNSMVVSSIDELDRTPFNMFPNPSNGSVDFSGIQEIELLECFDLYGRRMTVQFDFNSKRMDVSSLNPGRYIVRINGNLVQSLIVIQ
ncbi:MAG: T9SS type A sorting domain-containing protein [Bacteroidota bacterium]